MTKPRLMTTSVVIALAGAITVGAALLPASGVELDGTDTVVGSAVGGDASVALGSSTDSVEQQVTSLRTRLESTPQDARGWATLALLLIERARQTADPAYYAEAQGSIARSLELDRNENDLGLAARAALLSAQHRFMPALRSARRALAVDPYSPTALGVRVDALTELGRLENALVAARGFDLRHPGLAATTRLAYQAELRGDDRQATQYFRNARSDAIDAGSTAFVEFHLGELAGRSGRAGDAGRHYAAALRASPGDPAATAGLSRLRALQGKYASAIRLMSGVVDRAPLLEYVIALGELHLLMGNVSDAHEQFALVHATARLARAGGVRPDLELAWFEADHGDPRRALHLARSEWRKRQPPMVADALAWALHANGRNLLALRYARLATAYGGDARSWHHRGVIEAALGRERVALTHLRRALGADPSYGAWQAKQVRLALHDLTRQGKKP